MTSPTPTKQELLLEYSDHEPDPVDDEAMTEVSPGVWTWKEKRRLWGGPVVEVTRCHVDASSVKPRNWLVP